MRAAMTHRSRDVGASLPRHRKHPQAPAVPHRVVQARTPRHSQRCGRCKRDSRATILARSSSPPTPDRDALRLALLSELLGGLTLAPCARGWRRWITVDRHVCEPMRSEVPSVLPPHAPKIDRLAKKKHLFAPPLVDRCKSETTNALCPFQATNKQIPSFVPRLSWLRPRVPRTYSSSAELSHPASPEAIALPRFPHLARRAWTRLDPPSRPLNEMAYTNGSVSRTGAISTPSTRLSNGLASRYSAAIGSDHLSILRIFSTRHRGKGSNWRIHGRWPSSLCRCWRASAAVPRPPATGQAGSQPPAARRGMFRQASGRRP